MRKPVFHDDQHGTATAVVAAIINAAGVRVVERADLHAEAHVLIAATGRAGLIDPAQIRRGQIVFALSNPEPEIDPRVALAAGASLASDGRAINNALAFPGLVRAAIDTRARAITSSMMIEAARIIASLARSGELVPSPLDRGLHEAIVDAVSRRVVEDGQAHTAEV